LEVAKKTNRPKNKLNIQPGNQTKIEEVNTRVEELESKIVNFINFIKKHAIEKENQQNLLKNYQAKFKDSNNENKEETNKNKKTFEEKFAEISQIPNKLTVEFDLEIPNNDSLYHLVKNAKDDLRTAYNNKFEKAEAQEKYKIAGENFKRLEGKIRSFVEILKKTIGFLEVDKKTLLEEELKIIIAKIDEEIPVLELKYLNNLGNQAKILFETTSRLQKNNGNTVACSLKNILEHAVLFVDEVKKKVFGVKNSQMQSSLKYALEKLNAETSENICKLEEINFINFQKSDEIVSAFNLFVLTLKQNAILLTKILNLSEVFYSKTLAKVFEKKLYKITNRSKSSNVYREKYNKEDRNKSAKNFIF